MAVAKTGRIDEVLETAVGRGDVPGVVAMAADDADVIYEGAAGKRAAAANASVVLAFYRLHTDRHASHAEIQPDLDAAIEIFEEIHDATWSAWASEAQRDAGLSPVSTSRLAAEVWEVVSQYDWVLTAGTGGGWAFARWQ